RASFEQFTNPLAQANEQRGVRSNQFRASKSDEIIPYNKQLSDLQTQIMTLSPVIAETSKRATEERILGTALQGQTAQSPNTAGSTDWAQIIQSNLTRLASLGIMFFLVAILVPQYRYNIRMAAFLEARADGIRLAGNLQPITHLDELEKAITAMSPNID